MRQHDMKYIGFKDQRENKQNSDNTTYNNSLALSWRSVLLMEETEAPGENHRPATSHRQIVLHNVVSSAPRHLPDLN
jgi:hypothetical protein